MNRHGRTLATPPLDACGSAFERVPNGARVARGLVEPELEHRLHQRHELRIGCERNAVELADGRGHRQVRQVHRDQVDGVRHQPPVECPEVDRLEVDDARILPERAEELTMARVDGVDVPRAGGEECAREAPCSGAEIESDAAGDANVEPRECSAQLGLLCGPGEPTAATSPRR